MAADYEGISYFFTVIRVVGGRQKHPLYSSDTTGACITGSRKDKRTTSIKEEKHSERGRHAWYDRKK